MGALILIMSSQSGASGAGNIWGDLLCMFSSLSKIHYLPKPLIPNQLYSILTGNKAQASSKKEPAQTNKFILGEPKLALLVEDNETNLLIAIHLLEKIGFQVDVAINGFEGVNKAMKNNYDIIFMPIVTSAVPHWN